MVFGNLGDDCATGVGLTRNCSDGTPGFCGDYLMNAQGEDVVAGTRTPKRVEETLSEDAPEAYEQLNNIGKTLEQHYKEVQDIEFTVQKGQVWMLQTRNAKRTGFAAVRIAVDLVNEGLIDAKTAIREKRRIPATTSTSCCNQFSIRLRRKSLRRKTGYWRRASMPVPEQQRVRSSSTLPTPKVSGTPITTSS